MFDIVGQMFDIKKKNVQHRMNTSFEPLFLQMFDINIKNKETYRKGKTSFFFTGLTLNKKEME